MKDFERYLKEKELSPATIEKYTRDIANYRKWEEENYKEAESMSREKSCAWKAFLLTRSSAPSTINAAIAAVNAYADFMQKPDCRLKYVKTQRRSYIKPERQITKEEYEKLIRTAGKEGKERLAMMIETIGATGMRVSELQYVTVENIERGSVHIRLKGKDRCVLLPGKLCVKLKKYARKNNLTAGVIFKTKSGKPIGRKQIWAEMKKLCEDAKVAAEKVFPHNLRHLFARLFFAVSGNIAELADVLGHSSMETTRIYLRETEREHRRKLESLRLIC